ncbi:dipeptidyl peptidase 4-like [Dreissena polymorpha]|uniref:Uncharacterized protein n=1 Tax=Dreissena polymorpha TaxID=45954 RepID=A0A9D4I9J5_DREPO|nr:dipeptidyl peptidase 4-like [Dreissena polymorpha]KAH3751812.1 hypothetical protein DPMN_186386 [Dreissena polymorpha]
MFGDTELVGKTQEKRNWRGIIIALLVILTVIALIVTATILVTPKTVDEIVKKKLDFRGFIKGEYEPKTFNPTMIKGEDAFLYRSRDGGVYKYDCKANITQPLFDNSSFKGLNTDQFSISADGMFALFQYNIYNVYRHSTLSKYKVINITTKQSHSLVGVHGDQFQTVSWSPVGHSLVFVQYNDLYYMRDPTRRDVIKLTFGGFEDIERIFNGVPDWVYEEEILRSNSAFWFSPDGSYILYASFDDRDVMTYEIAMYDATGDEFGRTEHLAYPKPGTPNPKVALKVVHLISNATSTIPVPTEIKNIDYYFTAVTWQDESHVLVTWMNRAQNMSILSLCEANGATCKKNLRVESPTGWVDLFRSVVFKPDGSKYFLILPQTDGAAGSFQHIAMVDSDSDITGTFSDGSKTFITAGQWDVFDIVGYDNSLEQIYFTATNMDDPTEKHLYRATVQKDSPDFKSIKCLSCDVSKDCLYVDATFTSSGKYYILACKGPGIPIYYLYSTENGLVTVLEDNADLRTKLEDYSLAVEEFLKLPIDKEETDHMWVKALLPPVLRKEEITTYNILFKVNGSPGTQLVTKEFNIGWEQYLCSCHSVIIVFVDGRGSGGRGNRWMHAVYKQLGQLEADDIITAANHFNNLHYVNENTTVWGASYGGFLAASVIARASNAFRCGMAVSPVTDWRYYDSVFTERYMGLPTANDNLGGYNAANISKYASNFKSARFMILHGTGDDNVHFQNSAQLIKALVEEDVYFRQQIYPDENHFLNGQSTKIHLYNTMEDFILHCYGKPKSIIEFISEPSEKDVDPPEEEETE